jgi:hypothetical protein
MKIIAHSVLVKSNAGDLTLAGWTLWLRPDEVREVAETLTHMPALR